MSSIGQRIKQRRTEMKLTQGQVGERAGGLAYQTIQDLENGTSKRTKHTVAIAQALKVDPHWLETGEGPMTLDDPRTPAPDHPMPAPMADINFAAMPKNLPVMGNASCGEDGLFEFNGQVLDYVRRPPRLMGVKDAYALWIDGDSMAPWREHGGLIVVHPYQPVHAGNYVVVQLKPGQGHSEQRPAYIKRLVKKTSTSLVLRQYNPPKDITIPLSKVLSIHRILDWDEAMGF